MSVMPPPPPSDATPASAPWMPGSAAAAATPGLDLAQLAPGRAKAAVFFVASVAVLEGIGILVGVPLFKALAADASGQAVPDEQWITAGLAVLGHMALFLMVALVACITYCMWLHRAYRNAMALGGSKLKHTPGWAVGWHFIPIANLFKPYQVMRELGAAGGVAVGGLATAWWVCYILHGALDRVSGELLEMGSASMVQAAMFTDWAGSLALFISAASLVKLIRGIQHGLQVKASGGTATHLPRAEAMPAADAA